MKKNTKEKKITIKINSDLDNVALVGTAINRLCSFLSLSNEDCADIQISVVEAVNNAIIHAYGNEIGHDVEVVLASSVDRLVIDVCDTGRTMREHKPPSLIVNPDERKNLPEGKMGLFLIHKLMDKVIYETSNGKNTLTMTRFLGSENKKMDNNGV